MLLLMITSTVILRMGQVKTESLTNALFEFAYKGKYKKNTTQPHKFVWRRLCVESLILETKL